MSSLKMHIAISLQIQKHFNFSDAFLLGAILPDMFKTILNDKAITHFLINDCIVLEDFINSQNTIEDELILGYYAHLIEDNIWYEEYMKKKYRLYPEYTDDKIYNDYAFVDSIMYEKLNINMNDILERLFKTVEYTDITKIKLLNDGKINALTIEEIKETIKKNCKDYYCDGNNYFYDIEDAEIYYKLALKELTEKIEKIINYNT